MKKHIYKIVAVLLALFLMQSCETDLKTIDEVYSNIERGAVLRTVEIVNPTFDFNNTTSQWIITVEAQDVEDGKLLSEIRVYSSFVNDGTAATEVLVKTISPSGFTIGPFGFLRGDIVVSLQEVLNKAGMKPGDYDSSDSFTIRLESVLKDGRTFTSTNTVGTITGGSFFSSPFQYSVQFFCALEDASDFNGNYIVISDAWADYEAGDIVPVQFVSGYKFRIMTTNHPFIDNQATAYIEVILNPDDGSVTAASNECFNYPGFACLDVTGTGSVGTCTGDINLVLNFGSYTDNSFSLVKQ